MSAWLDSYYSVTLNARGHKFIGIDEVEVDPTPINLIQIESDATIKSYKIAFSIVTTSIESSSLVVAKEIVFAKTNINSGSVVVAAALEILKPIILISIESNLVAVSSKIAFARADLSGTVDLVGKATNEVFASSNISVTSQVTVPAIEILFAQVSTSAESEFTAEAIRTPVAQVQINIVGYKLTLAQEILLAKTNISGSVDINVISSKIAYLEVDLESETMLSVKALEIVFAKSAVESQSAISVKGLEILFAKVQISGFAVKVTVGEKYANARFNGNIKSRLLKIPAIRFSPAVIEDTQHIRPLLIIDGKPLTEHNRKVDINILEQFAESQNWASTRNRYYKKKKARKSFTVSWTFVPNSRDKTVDQKHGRDTIREIGRNPKILNMKLLEIDSSGLTPYTETSHDILVTGYQENLVRRDVSDDTYYWDCNLTFEEV